MATNKQKNLCIAAFEAVLEDAITMSGADLSPINETIATLRTNYDMNPAYISEADILTVADMLSSFLLQSFYNIKRFFTELSRDDVASLPIGLIIPQSGLIIPQSGLIIS